MKKIIILIICFLLAGCSAAESEQSQSDEAGSQTTSGRSLSDSQETNEREKDREETVIKARIDDQTFEIVLNDSQAAEEFKELLPLTVEMEHVNGNEVYAPLGEQFTANNQQAGQIHAGDLKLWSGDGLVLFYKDFSSNYSYTDLGRMTDSKGLADALEQSSTVRFERE
ncbi:cyclophilin-like fold protein [Streptococcus pantholopis]|uniref:Cyclophilin-like domain-containing protein n=1 Tax=Streptococcus pantholopis TaxID=1811193 RepID=A0A172Q5T8_9STRE|nr:cyclophilin-like fold protein [Streptococcus pantholopis]AND78843.1 hypothetical protein A0O21_01780 [Streptococcus pantholopis]